MIVRSYGYQAWKSEIAIIQNEATIQDIYLVSFSAEGSLKGIVNGFVPDTFLLQYESYNDLMVYL
jgi:hypothetical protein